MYVTDVFELWEKPAMFWEGKTLKIPTPVLLGVYYTQNEAYHARDLAKHNGYDVSHWYIDEVSAGHNSFYD